MKKISLAVLLIALWTLGAGTCPAREPEAGGRVWKIGTLAPDNVGWAKHAKELIVEETIRSTKGAVRPRVYWGGVMGDDEDYLAKMRIGQLDGAGLSGQGAVLACPEFAVLELPFLFSGYDEVDYLRKKMYSRFDGLYARYGLKLLYWLDQDFDQMYSAKSPMAKVEEFKKLRFVLWYGPVEEALLDSLDADWVPLNVPETALALRTGSVNSFIGPSTWMVAAQLGPVVKYVNPARVRYSPVVVVISTESWNNLPGELRKIHEQNRESVQDRFVERVRKDNSRSYEALLAYGVKETRMSGEELLLLKERASEVYGEMSGILFPPALLEEVRAVLKEYRAR